MLPDATRAEVVDVVHGLLVGRDPARATDPHEVASLVRHRLPLLPETDVLALSGAVTARAVGLGPLEPLLTAPDITEVMVNGSGAVWIERAGCLEVTEVQLARGEVELVIERIVGPLGLRVDRTAPLADARLPDGSRVNVVVPPLAVDGPCITIRRFGARRIPLDAMCPPGVAELLTWAVRARANVLVSGGTGAGKTTVLNALGGVLPSGERLVTVEDTAELRLPGDHVVRLEARPATADGLGAVDIRSLVRNALRMRPDRIIVGEVRGPEAVDMLWAMNTGHEGSLSTCHANSPADALRRLEVMVLTAGLDLPLSAVRDQLAAALDLVVHVARLPAGGRGIVSVAEVVDPPTETERVRPLADRAGLHQLPRPTAAHDERRRARGGVVSMTLLGSTRARRPRRGLAEPAAATATPLADAPLWAQLLGEELGGRIAPAQLVAAGRAGALVLPPVALVAVGPFGAVLLATLFVLSPRLALPVLVRRRALRRDRQLSGALERIAASVRAGASIARALDGLAVELDEPLAGELHAIAAAADHGVPLRDALDAWVDTAGGSRDVALAGAALALGAEAGGPVARAIDNVAATLRERRQLQAEVRALATQVRASAWLLAIAPLGFAALMATVEPRALRFLVSSPAGWLCLGTGIGLDLIGALWMRRLVGHAS